MVFIKYGFFILPLLVLASCTNKEPSTNVPKDWIRIEADKFVFWMPPFLTEVATRGLDSSVQRWESENILIQSDYGRYSDPLTMYSRQKAYHMITELIDGKIAKIVNFQQENGWRFTAVHFPNVEQDSVGHVLKLTLVLEASPHADPEVPLQIIKSVRFSKDLSV